MLSLVPSVLPKAGQFTWMIRLNSVNSSSLRGYIVTPDYDLCVAEITSSMFTRTEGRQGGAVYSARRATGALKDVTFHYSMAVMGGGALMSSEEAHISVDRCAFHGSATASDGGGALMVWGALACTNSIFEGDVVNLIVQWLGSGSGLRPGLGLGHML